MKSRPLAYAALAAAGALAVAGAVLALRAAGGSDATTVSASPPDPPPAPEAFRLVCSLSNDDARAALVAGADGGIPVTTSGRETYWLFGDTLYLPQSGREIGPNSIARARGIASDGCPQLDYHATGGIAAPFLDKDGALTVWPAGAYARDDGSIDLYAIYVYGSGPHAYWIGDIGVVRLDPATMTVEMLERRLWTDETAFPSPLQGVQTVDVDDEGHLRVIIHLRDHAPVLARVDRDEIDAASAYQYWSGSQWRADPSEARPLWPFERGSSDIERLAAFEGGVDIAWNSHLGQYLALMNDGAGGIGARTADRLEGPWSERARWVDCDDFAEPAVPLCYTPFQHPELSPQDAGRLYIAVTRMAPYDVVILELTLPQPEGDMKDGT